MAKILYCKDIKDIGVDCEGVIRGETEQEVLRQAAEHAKTMHNLEEMPEEVKQAVRLAIRDE